MRIVARGEEHGYKYEVLHHGNGEVYVFILYDPEFEDWRSFTYRLYILNTVMYEEGAFQSYVEKGIIGLLEIHSISNSVYIDVLGNPYETNYHGLHRIHSENYGWILDFYSDLGFPIPCYEEAYKNYTQNNR